MSTDSTIKDLLSQAQGTAPAAISPVRTEIVSLMTVTGAQLRAAVNSQPNHPKAKDYAKALESLRDTDEVQVDKQDILALLQNKTVKTEVLVKDHPFVQGQQVRATTKVVSDEPGVTPTPSVPTPGRAASTPPKE